MNNVTQKILILAAVRRYVDNNFPEGIYFDVMERIQLPSEDGDYADHNAVIVTQSRKEKAAMENLFEEVVDVSIAIILL